MRRTGRSTIRHVAEAAGVSTATVSRVFSGQRVRTDLADRVRSAAGELGYQPNSTAQGLVSGLTRTVGLVVPDVANPYFGEFIQVIAAEARRDDFRILVAEAPADKSNEFETCMDLNRHVDGVILIASRMTDDELVTLNSRVGNLVSVNRNTTELRVASVSADAFRSMSDLCAYLCRLGHENLVYLSGPASSWQNGQRWAAVQDAGGRSGVTVNWVPAGESIEDGYAATDAALSFKPTALLAFNDLLALGVMSRLNEIGLNIPVDISIAGTDDIPFARYVSPSLTTTTSPRSEVGLQAWSQLLALMAGTPLNEEVEMPIGKIIIRQSTGPAPSREPVDSN